MTFQRTDFTVNRDFTWDIGYLVREGLYDGDPFSLAMPGEQVGQLSWPQRERRILHLLNLADLLFYQAGQFARTHGGRRQVAAVAGMLSGGNDSTVTAYAMRRHLTHLLHCDTGVCLSTTREFSRKVAADLGLPLLVPGAERVEDTYEYLVTERGFPGPARHDYIMNRLKERRWRTARRQLITDGRKQRIIQVAGRRRSESARRANVPEMQREYSVVWVSPMVLWTKLDLNTFRRMYDVPVNPVYAWLHYSGECLCGSKARKGERELLFRSFPDDPAIRKLQRLEGQLAGRTDIPERFRTWGCGEKSRGCTSGMCND